MIQKKIVIIFMAVYLIVTLSFFAYASLLSPFISKLAPAAAAATGSGGGFTIPAKVLAKTSTGANVASWISLAVPGSTGAKIVIAIMGVAGALAADYLESTDWFTNNKITKNNSGTGSDFTKHEAMTMPSNYPYTYYYGDISTIIGSKLSGPVNGNGVMASQAEAAAARDAYRAANCPSAPAGTVTNYYFTMGYYVSCTGQAKQIWFYITYYGAGTNTQDVPKGKSSNDIENALAADLSNEDSAAKNTVKESLNVAAAAMDNPGHPVAKNTNTYNTINNYLTQNLTTNQLTNLEAAATPNVGDQVLPDTDATKAETLTAAQIAAAVAAALANQGLSASQIAAAIAAAQSAATGGLTQAELASTLSSEGLTAAQIAAAIAAANPAITQTQVKTAVKEAIDDETGITPPVDPVISLPDKLSLTTILNDFWTSVQALPIFNVLNGITITTSGSSNLCIDLPADYGGQRCYNAANVQDELNMIGSVILGLTTVVSFIGIFKG